MAFSLLFCCSLFLILGVLYCIIPDAGLAAVLAGDTCVGVRSRNVMTNFGGTAAQRFTAHAPGKRRVAFNHIYRNTSVLHERLPLRQSFCIKNCMYGAVVLFDRAVCAPISSRGDPYHTASTTHTEVNNKHPEGRNSFGWIKMPHLFVKPPP